MGWTDAVGALAALDAETRARLDTLSPEWVSEGRTLFRAGESARGFVIVIAGRIEVFLTGPGGRDILLYGVEPGGTCVQSTLSLLGGDDYSGEAVTATECRLVLVPKAEFLALMAASPGFRAFVLGTFASRMQGMMQVLEQVAFRRIESRLAQALLDRAVGNRVQATHQQLATHIGSAREVVSRQLEAFARRGLVATERGAVQLIDTDSLRQVAAEGA